MYVRKANGDGRKRESYTRGGCSCASWLLRTCTSTYPRGLPVGGYFVLYQRSIKPIQRWRSMNVHLQMIRMLNSRSMHVLARNSFWGRDARQLRRWSIYGLPPEE